MFAYVVRPVGDGPFPLAIMNHGVSLDQRERSFFPLVEFRDAAMWFARKGYMVVAPSGKVVARAGGDGDELIVHRCDLDAGQSYKRTTFNFAIHRQPDHYRMIVERKGAMDPP